jgi:hypothetical protein
MASGDGTLHPSTSTSDRGHDPRSPASLIGRRRRSADCATAAAAGIPFLCAAGPWRDSIILALSSAAAFAGQIIFSTTHFPSSDFLHLKRKRITAEILGIQTPSRPNPFECPMDSSNQHLLGGVRRAPMNQVGKENKNKND